jgi:transposase-like protein
VIDLSIPRDRAGTFEPVLVPKGVTRLDGFDDKIISLYARGLPVREIQAHLKELYGVAVSPDLISRVTDAVLEEVTAWQNRPLEALYPIVFFDALRVKVRDEGIVKSKAVYVALASDTEGQKHVLGLWIEQTEGAKFWLKVMNELKTRSLNDILIAVVDGLKGFPEAIGAVYPQTMVQTCIVHLIRNSLAFVSWKDRKSVIQDLKQVYRAATAELAPEWLDGFEKRWARQYPTIAPMWRRAWDYVTLLFAFPPAIRKMIYTTNAVERLNRSLRKVIKTRGSFPTDDAALELLYLPIRNAGLRWRRPIEWTAAMSQFAILFGDHFVLSPR